MNNKNIFLLIFCLLINQTKLLFIKDFDPVNFEEVNEKFLMSLGGHN